MNQAPASSTSRSIWTGRSFPVTAATWPSTNGAPGLANPTGAPPPVRNGYRSGASIGSAVDHRPPHRRMEQVDLDAIAGGIASMDVSTDFRVQDTIAGTGRGVALTA